MAETPRPPVAIRIVRPYETEEAFLENELETVGKTSIILIGAHSRPAGVILRFEVTLSNGTTVLRGEGRVLAFKESAFRGQPGLALRFTRLDPKSKALVDRAAALRDARLAAGTSAPPPSLAMPAVSMPAASIPVTVSAPPQSDPGDPMMAQILASPTPPAPSVEPLHEASESAPPPAAASAPPPPVASAPPPPVAPDGNALRQAMAAVFEDAPPVPVEPFVPLASLAPSAPFVNEPVATPENASAVAPDNRESILSRLRSRAASLTPDERDALTRPPR